MAIRNSHCYGCEMHWVCSTYMGDEKYIKHLSVNLKNLWAGIVVVGRTTLKLISRRDGIRQWTRFSWYKVVPTGSVSQTEGRSFVFHERANFLDQLKSSQLLKKDPAARSSTLIKMIRDRNSVYQGYREQDKGSWSIVCGYCTPGDRNSYINIRYVALPPLTRPPVDLADGADRIAVSCFDCCVTALHKPAPYFTRALVDPTLPRRVYNRQASWSFSLLSPMNRANKLSTNWRSGASPPHNYLRNYFEVSQLHLALSVCELWI